MLVNCASIETVGGFNSIYCVAKCMATLRDLGLSDYERRIYHGLLERAPATAQETAEQADVPEGRVYNVLSNLAQDGLVQLCETGHPKTYEPVAPAVALNCLLEAKQAELDTTRRQYETLVSEVADELASIDPVQHPCETATICLEETPHLLTDQLASATQEVLLTISAPSPAESLEHESVVEALVDAAQNGADASVLIHPDHALVDEWHDRIPAVSQEAFDIRMCEMVTNMVACLDGERLVTESPSAFQQPPGFLLIDASPEVVDQFRHPFRQHWQQAQTVSLDPLPNV
jgi:sugar-specific transcriptional regulator TrmB